MGSRSSNKIRNRKFPLIFILYFSLLSGCFCSHYSRIEMSWWKQITLSHRNRIQNENKKHTGEYQTFFSTSNAIFILHTFVSFFSRLSSSFEAITFVFQKKLLHFFWSSKVSFFFTLFQFSSPTQCFVNIPTITLWSVHWQIKYIHRTACNLRSSSDRRFSQFSQSIKLLTN